MKTGEYYINKNPCKSSEHYTLSGYLMASSGYSMASPSPDALCLENTSTLWMGYLDGFCFPEFLSLSLLSYSFSVPSPFFLIPCQSHPICKNHDSPWPQELKRREMMIMKIKSTHNSKSLVLLNYYHSYLGLNPVLTTTLLWE